MGTLTPVEILGLLVIYQTHFLPIAVVFLLGVVRYSRFKEERKSYVVHVRNVSSQNEPEAVAYVSSDAESYERHRRIVRAIIPFHLYMLWLVVNAGMEATAMFLVWFNEPAYPHWVYHTSMGLQFAIFLCKIYWLLSFFSVTSYKNASIGAALILILTVTNTIILVQARPGLVYNWILNILVSLFYLYTFLVMVHFYHVTARARHYGGEAWASRVDVFGMFYPEALEFTNIRRHGAYLSKGNLVTNSKQRNNTE